MIKTRLLFITWTHSGGGGAEKVLTTLVNNLNSTKYEIAIQEVADLNVKKEPINANIKLLPPLEDGVHKLRFSKQFTQYCLETVPELIRAVRNLDDYDVIITWNYQLPSFMLPSFPDKKTVAWFHGAIDDLSLDENLAESTSVIKLKNALQKKAWSFADRIVTISNKSLQSLRTVFPEYMSKAQIVHNPFDIESVKIKAKEKFEYQHIRATFPIIVCIGRLDKNKNFSLVIEAVAKLRDENFQCTLLIIGEGEEKENLIKLAKRLGVSEAVQFLGYKQNPLPYLKQADILCVSSLSEGFPTVVLEVMALGKPFVTSPVAGASEELADGEKCGLVANWDKNDFAEKIKMLLTDKNLYNKMSEKCVEMVKEFSVENAVRRFDKLISSLPEKDKGLFKPIDKKTAIKKLRSMYLWCPRFVLRRVYYAINNFCKKPTMRSFLRMGYYALLLFLYIPLLPIRIFTTPDILKTKGN